MTDSAARASHQKRMLCYVLLAVGFVVLALLIGQALLNAPARHIPLNHKPRTTAPSERNKQFQENNI